MAHFIIYKRPNEITPYEVDFTDLLPDDAALDSNESKVTAFDTLEVDQSSYFISKVTFDGMKMTALLVNGLDGEDYNVFFDGVGQTTKPVRLNRLLEVRVRSVLAGNL